jgi:CO dehydrogenase/acetyl-CoA synthase gamma subunit (corrinoid Fe-S protein)
MRFADMYYQRINVARHLPQPGPECRDCDAKSCRSFAARLENGLLQKAAASGPLPPEECPYLTRDRLHAFRIALAPNSLLPEVELSQLPRPVEPGLIPTGPADTAAPVLVTTNNEGTVAFTTALLALTTAPFHLLMIEARGDSVDMSLVLGSLTAARILEALERHKTEAGGGRILILPGFAAPLADETSALSGRKVTTGPVCGAELPLFLGDLWRAA